MWASLLLPLALTYPDAIYWSGHVITMGAEDPRPQAAAVLATIVEGETVFDLRRAR